jgi:hypothetical protein
VARPQMIAAAALVLCAAVLVCLRAILPLSSAFVLGGTVVWFTLPGVFIARTIYAKQPGASIGSWLLGGVLGHAFSSLALLGLWVAGVRSGWILVLAPLAACSVAYFVRPLAGRFTLPPFTRADVLAVLLLLLIVPLVVGRPFAKVGVDLPDGRAYRAYFTADFVWRMAVAAELSKGDVPPRNQFYLDDPLRYYWLPHLLPAIQYRLQAPPARLEQVLLVNSVVLDLVFVAFLYGLCRQLVSSPSAAVLGCVGAVLFTSFEGTERLWYLWRHGQPLERLRYLNIDAIENWEYGALKIDGLQRLLWYQPHHAMGYAVGLIGLLNATQTRDVGRFGTMVWIGSLLACSLLLSTFAALMLATMTALYVGIRLITERRILALVPAALGGAIPLGIGFAVATWLQYIDRGETLIQLGLNRAATHGVVASLLLNAPMLATGMVGLWIAMRRNAPYADIFGVIVGVSALYYFFVDVKDHQHVYVGFRFGHFMFIACAALVGYVLQAIARAPRPLKLAASIVVGVIALGAVPTAAIDIYNTQDTSNRALGPGFRWTLVLTPDEIAGFDWIRRHTPPDAIVQVEPSIHDSARAREAGGVAGTWAYVPAFAERRMAGGIPIGMVPLDKYLAASRRVTEIYEAGDWRTAYERAKALRVDYLMVGPAERSAYPALEPMLDSQPTFFEPVFHNGSVSIFHVAR